MTLPESPGVVAIPGMIDGPTVGVVDTAASPTVGEGDIVDLLGVGRINGDGWLGVAPKELSFRGAVAPMVWLKLYNEPPQPALTGVGIVCFWPISFR